MDEDSSLKVTQVYVVKGQEFDEGALVATIEEAYWDKDDELVTIQHEVFAETGGTVDTLELYPEMMVGSGEVLLQADAKMFDVFSSIFSAILGTIAFSALTMFYFIRKTTIIEWLMLLPATILLYWPTFATDGLGLVLVALVYFSQKRREKMEEAEVDVVAA